MYRSCQAITTRTSPRKGAALTVAKIAAGRL
jgi:hypothetical protein